MADARLDGGAAAQLAFDRFGDAPLLAGDVDLELVLGRGVVAAIAAVGDDALEVGADLGLHLRDDVAERMAVVGVAGQRLHMGDELAALGVVERRGDRDLDAELVGPVRLALADAFDLRRVQRIDLLARAGSGAGRAPAQASESGWAKTLFQPRAGLDLAHDVAADPAEIGAQASAAPGSPA